jgi:hypothetical protein
MEAGLLLVGRAMLRLSEYVFNPASLRYFRNLFTISI